MKSNILTSNIIHIGKPFVLYDCERQCPIGIFKSNVLLAKYIYGKEVSRNVERSISNRIRNKVRIVKNKLGFPVAVRRASPKYMDILGDKDFHIFEDYPEVSWDLLRKWEGYRLLPAHKNFNNTYYKQGK